MAAIPWRKERGCMRIAVLWSCLSGYLNACLKELASRDGVQLFVCDQSLAPPQAPFDDSQFTWIQDRFRFRSADDADLLAARVRAFDPEILVFSSWNIPAYRRISRMLAKKAFRVLAMDNAWRATPKQRMWRIGSTPPGCPGFLPARFRRCTWEKAWKPAPRLCH